MVGPAHVITSMYGRDNFGKFFSDAVQSGDLLYVDKKRIDPMLTTAGYQSSGLLSGIDSQTILGQITPNVNTKERRYSVSDSDLDQAAVDYFGTTRNWMVTGYIQKDGTQLDFSGKKRGGPGDTRDEDHREIWAAYGEPGDMTDIQTEIDYLSRGNIRIMPEANGINVSVLPTKAQETKLRQYITWAGGEVIVDVDTLDGKPFQSVEYPRGTSASKVLADIRGILAGETVSPASQVAAFRYELDDLEDVRDVTGVIETETGDVEIEPRYSLLTDQPTIDFLENQDYLVTYKAMQVIDGKLYPPMSAQYRGEDGKTHWREPSQLGQWQKSDESPEQIKKFKGDHGVFTLRKGNGKTVDAAYNPYEHTSNMVLNDQFEEAYLRSNIVTVEFHIPVSELTSGYRAQYAKDAVGEHAWKAGPVARYLKDNPRMVYLTRWSKPVRILSNAEVAEKYKEILDGTNIRVPFNVVTPGLLEELRRVGVPINEDGSPMYQHYAKKKAEKGAMSTGQNSDTRYSVSENNVDTETAGVDTVPEVNRMENQFESQEQRIRENGETAVLYNPYSRYFKLYVNGNPVPEQNHGFDFDTRQEAQSFLDANQKYLELYDPTLDPDFMSDAEDFAETTVERNYRRYEQSKSRRASMQDVLTRIANQEYRVYDLYSMAEQLGFEDYEDLAAQDLAEAITESIQDRIDSGDISMLEAQAPARGLWLRPSPVQNPDTRYSITPEFERWYKENYGVEGELTDAQLRRALQRQERKAQRAEESAQAARTKAKVDAENTLTAWLVYHKKNMRRLSRDLQKKSADRVAELRREKAQALQDKDLAWRIYHEAKIREQRAASQQAEKDLRKEMTQQKRDAARTATEVERAKAAVQRDADVMAFKRQAAERLRIKSGQYTELKEKTREQTRLKRKAAERALKDSRQAAKKRAEKEIQNGVVKTIRDIPSERKRIERLQEQAKNLKTLFRPAYAAFVNQAKAIDDFAKRQSGGVLSSTLVNVLGGSSTTIESVFKRGLVDRSGNRIGDAMKDVFLVWDGKKVDEAKQALLQDYMLHAHNVDRMSFVKNARARLEAFEAENPWLRDMDQKEFAKLVAMTEAEIEKSGKQKAHNLAVQYAQLLDRYNRSQDKPIFADADGNAVTAETSRAIVEQYLAENPWLEEKAQGIYAWWDLFMRTWAVGDSLTLEQYEVMREIYPHYVPTYRADKKGVGAANFVGAGGATIGTAVKKAKGGLSEVVNIEDSFANLANKIIKLARTNELYKNIIDTALLEDGADSNVADMAVFDWDSVTMGDSYKTENGEVVSVFSNGFDMSDRVDEAERPGLLKSKDGYKLSARYDGQLLSAYISEDLYKSIARVTGSDANDISRAILKVGNTLTGPMKTAITGINPAFAMRNISRDLPTAVVNSISGAAFVKYYGRALAEMKRNSENWQVFQALGGTHAGYYNNNKGFAGAMAQRDNILARTGAALGRFNDITEAQTRFAEYLATIDRLGDTYENRLLGIKNAAEVTVDFSRKGWAGKYINAWVPYWNPAVQGIDKVVRSVIDSPDGSAVWKQASRTLGRAALGTVMLEAILQVVLAALGRRDEWEQLDDRTKDTYYCIPLADSYTFLKIPKNREWGSILGTPFMRLLEWANGRDDPFENYLETSIIPNFLPPLPSDTVGFSQWNDLTTNEDFAGRAIVPYAYEQGSLTEQYDADTSAVTKAIAQLLNFSPMQLDYIITDYFGDFGEMYQKATAPSTWSGDSGVADLGKSVADIFFGGFEADARYSNAAVSKYYDTMDRLSRVVQDKKNHMGTDAAKETIEYQTQTAINKLYGTAITDLNTEVRSLPDGEEKDAAKAEIARLAAEAMDFYEQSLAGNIEAPALQAEYEEYTPTVRKALIDLDEYSEDYKFKPTGNASASYTDPADDTREYVLTEDQKDQFHTIYVNQYNTMVGDLINQSRYSSATGEVKAEMLEDLRDDVLDQTKEEFFNWLVSTGVRSTAKAK